MELFLELLFTVSLSLLLSFLLAKLLSMASSDDVVDEKSLSVTEVIKKPVLIGTEKYMGFDSEKRERFVDEVVNCKEFEEKGFRVVSIRSSVLYNDTEIDDDDGEVSRVVRVEESDCGESLFDESSERVKFCETDIESENIVDISHENVKFGEIGIESENLVEEIPENVKFCETDIASENIVEESPENVKFSEIEVESENLVDESSENVKFGEIGIELENLVEESPENVKFCETDIESENIVEESPENVKFSEIEVESENLVDESSENVKFGEIVIESENLVEESPENVKFSKIESDNLVDESPENVKFGEIGIELENLVDESRENVKFCEIGIETENLVDESPENVKFSEIEVESENLVDESSENVKFHGIEEVGVAKSEEIGVFESNKCSESDEVHKLKIELIETEVLQRKENKGNESDGVNNNAGGGADEGEGLFDDWEGIERTDLEKQFGAAMVFVGSKSNADRILNIESVVKMQLYGLHKVAIEGTCCEPQPMALKVSARALWNAWQRLGNMSREVAMEQYITLLSRSIPGWKGDETTEGEKHFSDAGAERDFPSKLPNQPGAENEMKSEESKPGVEECDGAGVDGANSTNRDKQ